MKIVFLQTTSLSLPCLSKAVERLHQDGMPELSVRAFTAEDLFNAREIQRAATEVLDSHAVIFAPHGDLDSIPGFSELYAAAEGKWILIQPTVGEPGEVEACYLKSSYTNHKDFARATSYLLQGGTDNHASLICRILADMRNEEGADIPEAKPLPFDGIYHPDWTGSQDLESYLDWAYKRSTHGEEALTLGLWFYHGYWLNRDISVVDTIIREVERQNAVVIPVFHRRFPDPELGNPGAPGVVEKYYKRKGRVLIDGLLSPVAFSLTMHGEAMARVYPDLGVPIFQMIATRNPARVWEETLQAVTPMDVSISVAQPEFDGALITSVHCTRETGHRDPVTGATLEQQKPIPERIQKIVSLALNWARLRHIPPENKKIAILFHHYPPRNDMLGSAFGLDSFESVNRLLMAMQKSGYTMDKTWANGEALAFEMLEKLTNDRRYLPPGKMAERAADRVANEQLKEWDRRLPSNPREKMRETWGSPPGSILTHEGEYLIGGLRNGNVFLGLQPIRGKGENDDLMPSQTGGLIHDPDLPPPHQYLGYYRWIKEIFGADAVIHIGKHGTLEWLPGKSLGLSGNCFPDLAIQDLPNIYPYIINNPGEGAQAKRRSCCCIIDHLIPPMTSADKAEPLQKIEELLDTYYQLREEAPEKIPALLESIWNAVEDKNLHIDLALDRNGALGDPHAFAEKLHGYLNEIAVTAINDGLHILGLPPQGERMIDTLAQYLRLPSTGAGSLWEAVASHLGYDDQDLRDNPGEYVPNAGKTKGQIRMEVLDKVKDLLRHLHLSETEEDVPAEGGNEFRSPSERIENILHFVRNELHPNLQDTADEIGNTLAAAAGSYVPAGGAGAPTRGALDILPTGRNFYSVDPLKIPSPEAWECGVRLGDALIERYKQDEGKIPQQIGMTIWSSQTMRTRGDDVAEVLYLMGLKPVWHPGTGRIRGLEVLPMDSLKHPRLDVTLRVSGLFRDTFPNLLELIDSGVEMVAALKEPEECNFLARNVAADRKELELAGASPKDAYDRSLYRVFSCKPGAYGVGTDVLLENGQWKDSNDLGEAFMQWGAYAFRQGVYGANCYDDFRRRLGQVQLTVKNEDSREHDILIRDDWVIFQGGMNAAVKAVSGQYPKSYHGDASDPRKPKFRDTAEEARFVYRVRILNPKWIEGCKRHGFKGAAEFSHAIDHSFEWDATSDVLDDWQYEELARTYSLDPAMREFFKEHNPYAWQNITERLLEAMERGMWKDPGAFREQLQNTLLEIEGEIEDRL